MSKQNEKLHTRFETVVSRLAYRLNVSVPLSSELSFESESTEKKEALQQKSGTNF